MTTCARLVLRLLVCLLVAAGVTVGVPAAAGQGTGVPFGQGTHAFRRILFDRLREPALEPLHSVNELSDDPEHTLLIVLGDTRIVENLPDGLMSFVKQGGAALVATDRSWRSWDEGLDIRVTGNYVRTASKQGYQQNPDCPWVVAFSQGAPLFGTVPAPIPVVTRVATNRPSSLSFQESRLAHGLEPLAAVQSLGLPGPLLSLEPVFAVGGTLDDGGRLLVLADHSLFINEMLLQPDNDNIDFTYNCVDWLTEGGKRNRVLFVEEGVVSTTFDVPLKEVPAPPLEALVPVVNRALDDLQKDDAFNKLLREHGLVEPILIGLVVAATLLLAVYGLYRLAQARYRPDLATPLLDQAVGGLLLARNWTEQRHRHLLVRGNLWEPARALARQAFAAVLVPLGTGPLPTEVEVRGGGWRRWGLRRRVHRLWQLAYGATPLPVSAAQLRRLPREIDEVRAALAAGIVRLAPRDEENA